MPITGEAVRETFHPDDEGVDQVIEQLKTIIHQGNVRRLVVKDRDGRTLIEAPLTVGVVGAMLMPLWAAIAAIVAVAAEATIVVERHDKRTAA